MKLGRVVILSKLVLFVFLIDVLPEIGHTEGRSRPKKPVIIKVE